MLLAPEETLLLDLDDQLRRSACDRCRCQKLRCERPPIGSTTDSRASTTTLPTCRRCQRAGTVCTTSFQQRPGRPRLASSSDDQRTGGQSQQQSSRSRRKLRNLSRSLAKHDSVDPTNMSNDGNNNTAADRRRSSAAASASVVSVPDSPQHHDTTFTPLACSPNFSEQLASSTVTGPNSIAGAPNSDTLNMCNNVGSLSHSDHNLGFWDLMTPDNFIQSWSWSSECPPQSTLADKCTNATPPPSDKSADRLNHNIDTSSQRLDDICQQGENDWDAGADGLYWKLTELSTTLCKDAHHIVHHSKAALHLSNCWKTEIIERTLRSSESLCSLLDELRRKPSIHQGLLTPCSLSFLHPTVSNTTPISSTNTGFPLSNSALDRQLNIVIALNIATSYVCLNRIFKTILSRIYSVLSEGSIEQLPDLPGVQMAGLFADNNHLRVRLFAETCMHLVVAIHKRLEALTTDKAMGFGFLRPIDMVLGKGFRDQKQDPAEIDFRVIKDLCSQITNTIEDKAW